MTCRNDNGRKKRKPTATTTIFGLELAVRQYVEQEHIENVLARYCESSCDQLGPIAIESLRP